MEILRFIESIRTPFWDSVFSIITRFGEEMLIIVVFCLLFWCLNKKIGYVIGIVFFLSALIVQGMKPTFRIDRPWVTDPSFTTVEGVVYAATGYAFPSGHTQAAASYLLPLGAMLKHKIFKITFVTLAVLVAFSRMYLGVHFLSDVLASLIITMIITILAVKFIAMAPEGKKRDFISSLIILLISVAVIIIAAALYHSGTTTAAQVRDSVIAAGAGVGFAVGMYVERTYIKFSVKARNIPLQIVKLILGIAGIIGIQEGARVIGSGLIADGIRYFLMILWPIAIYPLIIKRFFTANETTVSEASESEYEKE